MNTPQKNPAQETGANVETIGQYTISVSKPSPGEDEDDAPPTLASGILSTISAKCSFNSHPAGTPDIAAHLMTPTPDGPPSDKVIDIINGQIQLSPNTPSDAYVNLFLEWGNVSFFATSFFPSEFGAIPGKEAEFDISCADS
jgi:hypothetical protein